MHVDFCLPSCVRGCENQVHGTVYQQNNTESAEEKTDLNANSLHDFRVGVEKEINIFKREEQNMLNNNKSNINDIDLNTTEMVSAIEPAAEIKNNSNENQGFKLNHHDDESSLEVEIARSNENECSNDCSNDSNEIADDQNNFLSQEDIFPNDLKFHQTKKQMSFHKTITSSSRAMIIFNNAIKNSCLTESSSSKVESFNYSSKLENVDD